MVKALSNCHLQRRFWDLKYEKRQRDHFIGKKRGEGLFNFLSSFFKLFFNSSISSFFSLHYFWKIWPGICKHKILKKEKKRKKGANKNRWSHGFHLMLHRRFLLRARVFLHTLPTYILFKGYIAEPTFLERYWCIRAAGDNMLSCQCYEFLFIRPTPFVYFLERGFLLPVKRPFLKDWKDNKEVLALKDWLLVNMARFTSSKLSDESSSIYGESLKSRHANKKKGKRALNFPSIRRHSKAWRAATELPETKEAYTRKKTLTRKCSAIGAGKLS